jgi:hypothetical protein
MAKLLNLLIHAIKFCVITCGAFSQDFLANMLEVTDRSQSFQNIMKSNRLQPQAQSHVCIFNYFHLNAPTSIWQDIDKLVIAYPSQHKDNSIRRMI